MKLSKATNIIKGFYGKTKFRIKKHSPEILIGVGIAGTVTSLIMACRATTKISSVLDESKETIGKIHEELAKHTEEYTEEDSKKDLTIVSVQTGLALAKLYAPAVLLEIFSISCMIQSHRIISKRNAALAAAYATVNTDFKKYRERVVERFGKDVDSELRHGVKISEVKETVIGENGEETEVVKKVAFGDGDYEFIFDETNPCWNDSYDYNLMFLKGQQSYMNDRLVVNKHLFLNDVLKELGFEDTKAGQIVGWTYDLASEHSDNYVDFGIQELCIPDKDNPDVMRHVIGLEFNCEGNIWDTL